MDLEFPRTMKTPSLKSVNIMEKSRELFPPCLAGRYGRAMSSRKGIYQKDLDDNWFMTWSAQSHHAGFNHPDIIAAMIRQLNEDNTTIQIELAERLIEKGPGTLNKGKLFFSNTGSDATEYAMKMCRYCTRKPNFLAFQGSFHGSSLGGLSLTFVESKFTRYSHPLLPGVAYAPFPYCYRCSFGQEYPDCELRCIEYLRYVLDTVTHPEVTAAVFVEPIQGHGGVVVPPDEYFKELRSICDENELLLIDDEVISGFGRTGRMFGIEHWGIQPDLILMAKPIASGMPLGAVLGKREIMEKYDRSCPESTQAGNDVACAAALATLNVIEIEGLVDNARKVGGYMLKRFNEMFEQYNLIGDVRGKGLFIGLELVKDRKTKKPAIREIAELRARAREKGLLISPSGTYGQTLRIVPPLILTEEQAEIGLNILEESLKEIEY